MKHFFRAAAFIAAFCIAAACHQNSRQNTATNSKQSPDSLYAQYWEERQQLFPLDATASGDYRYNDRMTITIAPSFRDSLRRFYGKYLSAISAVDTSGLKGEDMISYRLFRYEMEMGLEGLKYPSHYLPINQFWSPTLDLAVLGSGAGNQPFKTLKDYENFLTRLSVFPAWADTAIANMREGMSKGWVLPKALVVKVLPQLKAMLVPAEQSTFWGAVKAMPDSFSADDKSRIAATYRKAIDSLVTPTYQKLYDFMRGEYMAKARASSGISDVPGGVAYYQYLIKYWTTTDLTPDSIYHLGENEVARIEGEMNRVKDEVGFKGDLHAFFDFLNKDKQFFPFKTPKEVLDSFWAIKRVEDPALKRLFHHVPKSPFTIRQTEAFRAASASAEYNPPSEDGSRPGIFYVPIVNAAKYNAVGMETLFLHEAIPGHHYQISLQQENKALPKFRRFLWYGAYGEGWALYSESLGKELGLFTNPYQYFGHLSDGIHRAIRLVVDVGLHTKGMTREQAIDYMMAHEATSREGATAEIERYMAIPGQALSYKMGELAIRAERTKCEQQLGGQFNIAAFHDEVLGSGCVPLHILSEKLVAWAEPQ
jgi:uncharacterized protein (DUF885 family)